MMMFLSRLHRVALENSTTEALSHLLVLHLLHLLVRRLDRRTLVSPVQTTGVAVEEVLEATIPMLGATKIKRYKFDTTYAVQVVTGFIISSCGRFQWDRIFVHGFRDIWWLVVYYEFQNIMGS
jgi:hypothetical protein